MPVMVDLRIDGSGWQQLGDVGIICQRALNGAAALARCSPDAKVDVLLTDNAALQALNQNWRDKDTPTDVLSFPADPNPDAFLGDIAISYDLTAQDAQAAGKSLEAHLSHLVVHGFLHLLGYDHLADDDAEKMEALERDILSQLGFADPYSQLA